MNQGDGAEAQESLDSNHIKQCCARLYESEIVTRLLGDSFHPGGLELTERLGVMLGLSPQSVVLDAASGKGTSARFLAQRFGCAVIGVDLSRDNVSYAGAESMTISDRVSFRAGDAERLPVGNASVDAVICECAFCTFPDKLKAGQEFARVLRPNGRVGLSDITRVPGTIDEFADLLAWIACLADARPATTYGSWLTDAGFTDIEIERHDEALVQMIRDIGKRLLATEVLAGLKKIDLAGIDLTQAKRMTQQALSAAREHRLGYAIVCATKR